MLCQRFRQQARERFGERWHIAGLESIALGFAPGFPLGFGATFDSRARMGV
jgi:hypothetical protein